MDFWGLGFGFGFGFWVWESGHLEQKICGWTTAQENLHFKMICCGKLFLLKQKPGKLLTQNDGIWKRRRNKHQRDANLLRIQPWGAPFLHDEVSKRLGFSRFAVQQDFCMMSVLILGSWNSPWEQSLVFCSARSPGYPKHPSHLPRQENTDSKPSLHSHYSSSLLLVSLSSSIKQQEMILFWHILEILVPICSNLQRKRSCRYLEGKTICTV